MEIYQNRRQPGSAERSFRADAKRPLDMLQACPAYAPTRLDSVPTLAADLGIKNLFVKDETGRMGLGSFKALGGAFAIAHLVASEAEQELGRPVTGEEMISDQVRKIASKQTFITASAGNHGLSVAAGARVFGAKAVIVLSEAVPEAFARRIGALGAEVVRSPGNYEACVAHAQDLATSRGLQLFADGSWPGYTELPALIAEGYTVLAEECAMEFRTTGEWPTHIFLQAGVGGLACAVAAHVRAHWDCNPQIIVVEPDAAPCLMHSMRAGEMVRAGGPVSNMGRLDCKDASLIAYEALAHDADCFVTVSDEQAQAAAEILTNAGFSTTPSGSAGYAALANGADLGVQADSNCLVIVSEGPE